jgi:hypothetical protein
MENIKINVGNSCLEEVLKNPKFLYHGVLCTYEHYSEDYKMLPIEGCIRYMEFSYKDDFKNLFAVHNHKGSLICFWTKIPSFIKNIDEDCEDEYEFGSSFTLSSLQDKTKENNEYLAESNSNIGYDTSMIDHVLISIL